MPRGIAELVTGRRWLVLAVVPVLVFATWIIGGAYGPGELHLLRGVVISSVSAIAATAFSIILAVCAGSRTFGRIAPAPVLGAISGSWPAVQVDQYAGRVLVPPTLAIATPVGARRTCAQRTR